MGRAVGSTSTDPDERFLNPMGTVHGGWTMTLLDSALAAGESFVSLSTEVKFVRRILPSDGQVRAVAELQRPEQADGHRNRPCRGPSRTAAGMRHHHVFHLARATAARGS